MDPFLFKLSREETPSTPQRISLWEWTRNEFIKRKMESPIGYLILLGIALLFSWQIGTYGWFPAALWLLLLFVIPILLGALFNLSFGVKMTVVASFLVMGIKRVAGDYPYGVLLDASILMMVFGVYWLQIRRRDWRALYHTFTVLTVVWLTYNFIELFNPYSPSQIAWVYEVRNTALKMILFFIPLFAFKKFDDVKQLGYLWIGLTTVGAIYAIIQQAFGLQGFERIWLLEDVENLDKVVVNGAVRNFSFFSTPGIMGVLMGGTSIFCMPLFLSREIKSIHKVILAACVLLMWVAMLFSGTRTAFIIVPVSYAFILIISMRKRALVGFGVIAFIWIGLYIIPSQDPLVHRFRSTFDPSQSNSFQDRVNMQEYLQPYIRSHPIGGGIGLTGERGQQFSPDRLLSEIRIDSGYLRLAIEQGWIGLGIFLAIHFIVLFFAVRYYFRIKDHELKMWSLAFLGAFFAFCLGNYSQDVLTSLPISIFMYVAMSSFVLLRRFDDEDRAFDPFAW